MTRKISTLMLVLVWLAHKSNAQQFLTAGPDKETCEGKAVQIGPPDVNPELCYHWEPAEGLSCTDCANPMAKIDVESKEYTIHITDDDFSLNFSDQTVVMLNFGVITFDAQYVKQGTDETVTATLQRYPGGTVSWSLEGDDLGCSISGTGASATIMPGSRYGKLKVKAQLDSDNECITRATIDVNVGVKDIEVVDLESPGRKASAGQTLHTIVNGTNNMVKATAIPNDGETFSPPTPMWHQPYPNSVPVPDGAVTYTYDVPNGGSAAFTAGFGPPDNGPTTFVDAHFPQEIPIPLGSLTAAFNEKINNVLKAAAKFPNSPVELSFEVNLAGTELKKSKVEKYNDPELGDKFEFNLVSKVTVTGTLCHPTLCATIAFPEILGGDTLATSEVSLKAQGELQIGGGFVKDESMQDDSWNVNSEIQVQASLALILTVGGSFDFGGYTLKGETAGTAKVGSVFSWNAASPEWLIAKNFVEPLKLKINLYLENNVDPRQKLHLIPEQEYELIPKFETAPVNLVNLSSLFN